MSWSGATELKAQLLRLWERGDLLREALGGPSRFPLRLTLKVPGPADITDRFEAVRAWVAELSAMPQLRLEWQETRHRIQGMQRLPVEAWVDTLDGALAWLGRRRDWDRFTAMVAATRLARPAVLPWLGRRPLQALELAPHWPALLAVVGWFVDHPRPGLYLRQVDLPGVHTKFIEAYRGVLAELLDLALPADQVDPTRSGVGQFAARYGLRDKPTRIRMRPLDPRLALLPGIVCPDISLDADSFSRLQLSVQRVFITENEINFLVFPQVSNAIVIFGAGYGWDAMARAAWLNDCRLYYWGDIDTHGFAILHQLRRQFADTASFLMDRQTLLAHQAVWGEEDKPSRASLPGLTPDEHALYDDLRENRIRNNLRLEQEHIGFGWLHRRLSALLP